MGIVAGAATGPMVPLVANTHSFSKGRGLKAREFPPEATATYCRPFTEYVIAGALTPAPVWKCNLLSPVAASNASKLPLPSPTKTRPPAVANDPAMHSRLKNGSLSPRFCHLMVLDTTSSAVKVPNFLAAGGAMNALPNRRNGWPRSAPRKGPYALRPPVAEVAEFRSP